MKIWRIVFDNGMDIDTYVIAADSAEEAAKIWKEAHPRSMMAPGAFFEMPGRIYHHYESRWPDA